MKLNLFVHFLFFKLLFGGLALFAQKPVYTHADSLKGGISPERAWWDVLHYDLSVSFNYSDSSIVGKNIISYKVLKPRESMQIDLMQPMLIDSVIFRSKKCKYRRDGNAFFVTLPAEQIRGVENKLSIFFHGKPKAAKLPPWDGGVVWSKDKSGNPWISIACQGMAAGVWFPNKDHMYDEVNSASMHFRVPSTLKCVSNGKLKSVIKHADSTYTYNWEVKNPINNYCIIPYIGNYVNFKDTLAGEDGILDLDYWVLNENLDKAKLHFAQVKPMIKCFEYWFGKYPFYEDGYKLVEAPFLGMEHQSAIAYGNEYANGYKGRDLSKSGYGLKWDFIIVHESGHEWFGNSISAKDVADNWIHESFTAYSENLFVEWAYGKKAGSEYVVGTRQAILNDKPIIADYDVNMSGSNDVYYKGANMLHTIRQLVDNDSTWRALLRGLNRTFFHQTVSTAQIEVYMTTFLKMDLQKIFDQYLRTTKMPALECRFENGQLFFRWGDCVPGFNMPMKISDSRSEYFLLPTENWQQIPYSELSMGLDPNFYVSARQVK